MMHMKKLPEIGTAIFVIMCSVLPRKAFIDFIYFNTICIEK